MITTFQIDDLLSILGKNRDDHRAIFDEAVEGYKQKATELLEDHIDRIRKGDLTAVYVNLPRPEDHTQDYNRVIKMLELSTDSTIELDEHDFAQYVMDDWAWKRQFLISNTHYSTTAAARLREYDNA